MARSFAAQGDPSRVRHVIAYRLRNASGTTPPIGKGTGSTGDGILLQADNTHPILQVQVDAFFSAMVDLSYRIRRT